MRPDHGGDVTFLQARYLGSERIGELRRETTWGWNVRVDPAEPASKITPWAAYRTIDEGPTSVLHVQLEDDTATVTSRCLRVTGRAMSPTGLETEAVLLVPLR